MADYRVLCVDLVHNTIREELEVHDLKYSWVLDAPGSMSGWMSLDDPKCTRTNLDPASTAIYIERGGLLVWGGPLWTAQVTTSDRKLALGAQGFWSYFRHRIIRNRVSMPHSATGNIVGYGPSAQDFSTNLLSTVPGDFIGVLAQNPIDVNKYVFTWLAGSPAEFRANGAVPADALADLPIKLLRVVALGNAFPGTPMALEVRIGGTTYTQNPTPFPGFGTHLTAITAVWTTNPATGLAWTPSDIQAFASSSSFGFVAPFVANPFGPGDQSIYQLYIQVEWGDSQTPIFQGTDQLAIVEDLMNNSMAQPGSLTGITVPTNLTTDNGGKQVTRNHVYHPYERKNTATAIEELAALDEGFDFSIEVAWDATGTVPTQRFVLYYPRRGTRIDSLVWDYRTNSVFKFDNAVDGSQCANSVDAIGSGDADNMLIASVVDASKWTKFPLLESLLSTKDTIDPAALLATARAELARTSLPLETPSIETQASVYPDFGSYHVGDEGIVRATDGWLQVDSFHRVQSIEVTVSDGGLEIITPTFVSATVGL